MPARVQRNDTVKVITGKDAGKEGRVVRVHPKKGTAMVEGVNRMTRHTPINRGRRGDTTGGIEHVEVPVELSNLMPICPSCSVPTRVGSRAIEDGGRVRICRKCDADF